MGVQHNWQVNDTQSCWSCRGWRNGIHIFCDVLLEIWWILSQYMKNLIWYLSHRRAFKAQTSQRIRSNSVARSLKKLRTSKGDYWIKHWFSSIAPLFKMETSLKGKNFFHGGANSFLYEQFLIVWKSLLPNKMISLECCYFYYARV